MQSCALSMDIEAERSVINVWNSAFVTEALQSEAITIKTFEN